VLVRVRSILSVFRAAFRNATLRRVGFAYALYGIAEFGIWITLLVFAYRHGGVDASLVMVLVQLIPCIALGPYLGALADRRRPSSVLRISYALQAVSLAATAVAMGLDAPTVVVYILAPLIAIGGTVTRPPQAALLPAIVRTPEELTAANVMTGWTDGAASFVGPGLVGLLLAWQGPGLAVAALAGVTLIAMLLVVGVKGPAPAITPNAVPGHPVDHGGERSPANGLMANAKQSLASMGAGARTNVATAFSNPQIKVLLTLYVFYFILIGSLDLLCVILALDYLHTGAGGPGFLNAALGGGALLAAFVTAFLVGRRRLATTLTAALAVAVVALALVAAVHTVAPTLLFIGTVGLAGAVFDITGRTLLQRSAPSDAIAGSFSILEALMDCGLVLGAVLVRVAIAVGGLKAALFAPGVFAFLLIVGLWRRLQQIDASANVPQVEIQLLRSLPLFAALPAPSLEGLARELEPMAVAAGTVVIKEGEGGDTYYAVAQGDLAVSRQGRVVQTVTRGDGFGEIALIRDVPRQASVTATTDALLYTLHKDPFVQTVTGHATVASAAGTIISRHLEDDDPGGSDPDEPTAHDR
jgi:Na+/melibiose symporter-like transporter